MKCTHIVRFEDVGVAGYQYTNDLDYWRRFEEMWKSTFSITGIEEISWVAEQEVRLSQIQGFPDGWSDVYGDYVREGVFRTSELPVTHPMQMLERREVAKQQDDLLLDMAIDMEILKMEVMS